MTANAKSSGRVRFSAEKPPKLSFMESRAEAVLPGEESATEREARNNSATKKVASAGSKVKGKGGVAALFNRMTETEQKGKPVVKEEKRKENEEDASIVPSKGKRSPKKKHLKKVSGMELQEEENGMEPPDTVPVAGTVPAAGALKSSDVGQAGKKRAAQETNKDAKNAQKRRRVVVFSSDSEEEQEEGRKPGKKVQHSVHDEKETKKEEPISMTTNTIVKKQRKRVRRLKSRMFEDSDGSMSE